MKLILTILFHLIFYYTYAQNFTNEILIQQNTDTTNITTENSVIYLKKEPFSVSFRSKFHNSKKENFNGLRVMVTADDSKLKFIEEGTPINLIPFFEQVSTVPTNTSGTYTCVSVNDYTHHYLYYENATNNNVKLIATKDDYGDFKWTINCIESLKNVVDIHKMNYKKLTFIFLNDYNANQIIDVDELRIVKIIFK